MVKDACNAAKLVEHTGIIVVFSVNAPQNAEVAGGMIALRAMALRMVNLLIVVLMLRLQLKER